MPNKYLHVTVLVFGVVLLFLAFAPISRYYQYYESIQNLGGITYLLYIVPFFMVGSAVATLYKKLPNVGIWYASVGSIGLILTVITVYIGDKTLEAFIEFNSNLTNITPQMGVGAITMLISYFFTALVGYVLITSNKENKTSQDVPQEEKSEG